MFENVPNSKIEKAIIYLYKTEKNRNILRDRLFNGLTYEEIIRKHYPESDWYGRTDYNRVLYKLKKMVMKLEKYFESCGADMRGEEDG